MAKNEAKIKFTAETQEFNQNISKANAEMQGLKAELKLNEAQMKTTGTTVEGLKDRLSLLDSELKSSKDKVDALTQKVDKAAEIYGENSTEVQKLKTQLANARTAEEKIKQEISECNAQLDTHGKEFDEAEKSAGKFGETLKTIGTGAAKAVGTGIKTIVAGGVAATGALAGASVSAAGYADEILTMSTVTGVSTDKLQEFSYASELLDVDVETLTKSMAKNIKSMSTVDDVTAEAAVDMGKLAKAEAKVKTEQLNLQKAQISYNDAVSKYGENSSQAQKAALSLEQAQIKVASAQDEVAIASQPVAGKMNEMTEAYNKLGISVYDAEGNMRDGETVYWEVIDALGKMENETERDAVAMQILGKSAQELNPLIEAGSGKLKELSQEAHDVGAVLSEDSLDALGSFDDSLQRLQGSAGAAKNSLGGVLLPELQSMTDLGTGLLNDFTKGLNESGGGLEGLVSTIDGMQGKIASAASTVIGGVVNTIAGILPTLGTVAISLISTLISVISANLPTIVNVGIDILNALITGFVGALPAFIDGFVLLVNSVVEALPSLVQTIVQALPTIIPALVTGLVSMFVTICQNIGAIIQPIIDALPSVIISIVDAIVTNLPAIIEGLITLTLAIVDALPQILQALVSAIPTIVEMVVTALLENLPALISGLVQVVIGLVAALPDICISLVEGFVGVFKGIWSAIQNVFSNVGGWFSGKFSEAKEKASAAWSNAKEKFGQAWTKVQDAFAPVGNWFSTKFTEGKNKAVSAFSDIKAKFTTIKDNVVNAFSTIKAKLAEPFEKARDTIKGVADKIKGFFTGKIEMPKISLPHFGIEPKGWKIGDLLKGSIPKLKIDWYAEGGIMTRPTLFGWNGSSLMAGGEAGHEAILPIEKLQDYIANVIDSRVLSVDMSPLTEAIEDLANRPVEMSINGKKFASATASDTDNVNGIRNRFKSRGLAFD